MDIIRVNVHSVETRPNELVRTFIFIKLTYSNLHLNDNLQKITQMNNFFRIYSFCTNEHSSERKFGRMIRPSLNYINFFLP